MRVEFHARGECLAFAVLAGRLLLVPKGLKATPSGDGLVLEQAREDGGRLDLLVGDIPLVHADPETGLPVVSLLYVAPPPPFVQDDVRVMWSTLTSSPFPIPDSVPAQGRDAATAAPHDSGLEAPAVPAAVASVARLIRRWPDEETVDVVWRRTDIRGGREDAFATERGAGHRPGMIRDGRAIPDMTARRRAAYTPWASRRLGAACTALARAVEASEPPGANAEVLTILHRARALACSQPMAAERSISSWPSGAQSAYRTILAALVHITAASDGESLVPLCNFWRLYEAWIAVTSMSHLESSLGPGARVAGSPWSRSWSVPDGFEIKAHAQATVGREADQSLTGPGPGVISVSSDLRPDCLVVVVHTNGRVRLVCVDAKQRTSGTAMEAADVAAAASKYLWGLRSAQDRDQFVTTCTVIASSARVPRMHDSENSRIVATFTIPSGGGDRLREALLGALRQAMEATQAS